MATKTPLRHPTPIHHPVPAHHTTNPVNWLLVGGSGIGLVLLVLLLVFWNPRLSVKINPATALVSVDGSAATSFPLRVAPGSHKIEVSAAGYASQSQSLLLLPLSSKTLQFTLNLTPEAKLVVNDSVFALAAQPEQNLFYFLSNGGKTIFQLLLGSSQFDQTAVPDQRAVTPATLPPLERVIFAPDFGVAVFKLKNGETGLYDFKRYNLVNQEYHAWGKTIGDVIWRPDGEKLVYYFEGPGGERSLMQTNRQNSPTERIFDLRGEGIANPQLGWSPDGNLITLVANGNLYVLDYPTKTLTKLISGGVSAAHFATNSNPLFYTQSGQLYLVSVQRVDPFAVTTAAADIGKVVMGQPLNLGIQADARKIAFNPNQNQAFAVSNDNRVYAINLTSGQTKELAYKQPVNFSVSDLGISVDGATLFLLTNDNQLMFVHINSGS